VTASSFSVSRRNFTACAIFRAKKASSTASSGSAVSTRYAMREWPL